MKIHCIGIGGIGLSALARYYTSQGHTVTGSDISGSELIETLRSEGIVVHEGHDEKNVLDGIDLVVYTVAINDSNEELREAQKKGIPTKTYAQALGDVTKEKTTIAICGTHGKTTTTAMTYYAMRACGINPTLIVGSLLTDHGTNFMPGDCEYLIVESCEYKRSFLDLHPKHVLLTNIDEDHLDYYKNLDDIKSAFQSFVDLVPIEGTFTRHSDVSLASLCRQIDADTIDADTIELTVPGKHNQQNAQLVLAFLKSLNFDETKIRQGLKQFFGTWRRLEYKGKTLHGVPVFDDYGHHPREIEVGMDTLRASYPKGEHKIIMFFQPHLYSRTKAFLDDFVKILKEVDEVYILPIYRARLEDTSIINEDAVIDAINAAGGNAKRLESLSDMPACIEGVKDDHSVIINMGAGNAFEELGKVTLV